MEAKKRTSRLTNPLQNTISKDQISDYLRLLRPDFDQLLLKNSRLSKIEALVQQILKCTTLYLAEDKIFQNPWMREP